MEKETILPKNVRQIGDIQGNVRIYMEDYVMTFIHKKEQQEEKGGFLGVFLGETQRTEDEVRIFIRGLMEVSAEEAARKRRMTEKQRKYGAEAEWEESSDEEWREDGEDPKAASGTGNFLNKRFWINSKSEGKEKEDTGENAEKDKKDSIGKAEKSDTSGWPVWFRTRGGQEREKQTVKNDRAESTGRTAEAGTEKTGQSKVEKMGWTVEARTEKAGRTEIENRGENTGWPEREESVKNVKWTGQEDQADNTVWAGKTEKTGEFEKKDRDQSDGLVTDSAFSESVEVAEEMNRAKFTGNIFPEKEKKGQFPPRTVQEECREYFGAWEILGCCVIGEYPVERMKKLTAEVPQSQMLIYHLQEQEENLYCTENGRYEQISGYFVFYEENRLMQEYMAEALQEERTDKEGISDQAIKNFREKIRQKDHIRTGSMLKLASSFFVVTVLVIGAIAVNRIDQIRGVSSNFSETLENEVYRGGMGENGSTVSVNPGNTATAANSQNTAALAGVQNIAGGSDTQDTSALAGTQDITAGTDAQNTSAMVETQDITAGADAQNTSTMVEAQGTSALSGMQGAVAGADDSSMAVMAEGQDASALNGTQDITAGTDVQNTATLAETQDASALTGMQDVSESSGVQSAAELTEGQDASAMTGAQNAAAVSGVLDGTAVDPEGQLTEQNGLTGSEETALAEQTEAAGASTEAAARQTRASYVIKVGDTLADICQKYYGSLDKLDDICSINGITNANMIMPGDKIVLP